MVTEVQGKILAMLARGDWKRYSEAYPGEEIDDDLYNYHLQEMVRLGLVEKVDKRYRLTDKGKKEMVYLNYKGDDIGRIKVSVILAVTRKNKSEILIHRRNRHPHRGEVSTISGKVLPGEMMVEAAKRRLKLVAGLTANFQHWGDFRIIRRAQTGELFEDIVFGICRAEEPEGELIEKNEFGDNWWESYENIYEYLKQGKAIALVQEEMFRRIKEGKKSEGPMVEEIKVLEGL